MDDDSNDRLVRIEQKLDELLNRKKSKPPGATEQLAEQVLVLLNAGRKEVIEGARDIRSSKESLRHIKDRIRAGATLEEFEHVIEVCKSEVRRDPDTAKWFNQVTPFRVDNFARKLAQVPRETEQRKYNGYASPSNNHQLGVLNI